MKIIYSLQFRNSLGCLDTVAFYEDEAVALSDKKDMERKHPETEYLILSHYLHEKEKQS